MFLLHHRIPHTPASQPVASASPFPHHSSILAGGRSPLRHRKCCSLSSARRRQRRLPRGAPPPPEPVGRSPVACRGRTRRRAPSGRAFPLGQARVVREEEEASPGGPLLARPHLSATQWAAPAHLSGDDYREPTSEVASSARPAEPLGRPTAKLRPVRWIRVKPFPFPFSFSVNL